MKKVLIGAALGVGIGLYTGGIGIALLGTAIGVPGWLIGGTAGASIGGNLNHIK